MRSYHFLNRYPDKTYTDKFIRWAKIIGWAVLLVSWFYFIYVVLGGEQSYGGVPMEVYLAKGK